MKIKLSFIFNILIAIFVLTGSILMFGGIQFMGPEDGFSATKLEMLRFYTVDSNILMGIASLIFLLFESNKLNGKIEEIPQKLYVFKLVATVGTINLDYRSLYLHFECGCYFEDVDVIEDIKKDLVETINISKEITLKEASPNIFKNVWQAVLRLLAPMM